MSHHFDTPTSMEDPRLNLCDLYLFGGRPGFTTMAMTVNPEADLSRNGLFRDEGVYTFRFDTDGDGIEDVSFKVRFGEPGHADNGDHEQAFTVRRAAGPASRSGLDGELVVSGHTSHVADDARGRAFAGQARDAFAGNAAGNEAFLGSLAQGRYEPDAFDTGEDFFAARQIAAAIERITTLAGTAGEPAAYADQVLTRFGDLTLPYELGTPAAFTFATFNGRTLRDNAMDVMLSLTTNSALANGFAPDPDRVSDDFPHFDVVMH